MMHPQPWTPEEELNLVLEGLKDVDEGRIVDGPTAMQKLREKYDLKLQETP